MALYDELTSLWARFISILFNCIIVLSGSRSRSLLCELNQKTLLPQDY